MNYKLLKQKQLTFHGKTDTGRPTSSRCKGRKIHYCKYHRCSENSVYICLIHKEYSQSVWLENKATKPSFFFTFIKPSWIIVPNCCGWAVDSVNEAPGGMDTKRPFCYFLSRYLTKESYSFWGEKRAKVRQNKWKCLDSSNCIPNHL